MSGGRREKVELSGDGDTGWHSAYRRSDGRLVVEWLEYEDPAPYDHATMIVFSGEQERAVRGALGIEAEVAITAALAERFKTYWAVRKFADERALGYAYEVDFHP